MAIACPGVGLVQRGFERLFADLHHVTREHCDITLFKGGGANSLDERVLPFVPRGGRLLKTVPLHRLVNRTPMHVECLTFALALLPHLARGAFDLVHTIDPPLTRVLYHLRSLLGLQFALLYTEGCAMPPGDYPPADHIHQIAQTTYDEALAFGHQAERMTMIPCGLDPGRFRTDLSRQAIRGRFGIDQATFVILSVAAINRNHKRTHHLIEEVARLDGDVLLWLDGSLDHGDPGLLSLAKERLGRRCLITHVPSEDVGMLFRAADCMAHAALFEAFGLSVVEAAASGLPLLVHDAPHFRWLVPNQNCWLDMSAAGRLSARLSELTANPGLLEGLTDPTAAGRFAWDRLVPDYIALYRQVADQRKTVA